MPFATPLFMELAILKEHDFLAFLFMSTSSSSQLR
jgi:hypothetical protein